jgi:hypothetical protein
MDMLQGVHNFLVSSFVYLLSYKHVYVLCLPLYIQVIMHYICWKL